MLLFERLMLVWMLKIRSRVAEASLGSSERLPGMSNDKHRLPIPGVDCGSGSGSCKSSGKGGFICLSKLGGFGIKD